MLLESLKKSKFKKGDLLFFPEDEHNDPAIGLVVKNTEYNVQAVDLSYPSEAYRFLNNLTDHYGFFTIDDLNRSHHLTTKEDILKALLLMVKHYINENATLYLSRTIENLRQLGHNYPEFEQIERSIDNIKNQ